MTTYWTERSLFGTGMVGTIPNSITWIGDRNVLQAARIDGQRTLHGGPVAILGAPEPETAVGRPAVNVGAFNVPQGDPILVAWAGTDGRHSLNVALSESALPGQASVWRAKTTLWNFSSPHGVSLARGLNSGADGCGCRLRRTRRCVCRPRPGRARRRGW